MANKVFVSFDWENDRRYKHMLEAWHKNPRFEFTFLDGSSDEINSHDVGRVKAALTTKINQATHTLVIVGEHANTPHRDRLQIGSRNWLNYEIRQSKANGNRLVAVKIKSDYESPDELLNSGACWAMSFGEDGIIRALNNA